MKSIHKTTFLTLVFFTIFTALLGCGGGGGPVQEESNTITDEFNIPESGAVLIGDSPRLGIDQVITLSGGNSGTFEGVAEGIAIRGSYALEISDGSSIGNITLTYTDVTSIQDGTIEAQVTFTSINPTAGTYSGTGTRQETAGGIGDDGIAVTEITTFTTLVEGTITFIQ